MKRRYLTFTIRQLKAKLSCISRTTFKITRKFFKSHLGIDKCDWSRLNKAEIIRVLNYYFSNLGKAIVSAKTLLINHKFKLVSSEDFRGSTLPKLPAGQWWKKTELVDIGELGSSGVSLHYVHFQKVYPVARHQLTLWEKTECFVIVAELGKELYAYVSDCCFNVTDFVEQIEWQYDCLRP